MSAASKKSPAKTTTKPTTTASKKDPKKQKSTQSLAGEASQTIVKDVAEELKKIQEELIIERRERNYFPIRTVGHFWEITKSELHTSKADLLNKDRELEEQEEKHQVEIKVYKQKVKHLLYEYQNNVAHLQTDSERALQLDQEEHLTREQQLKKDKRLLKLELKEFELSHEDIIKNLKQRRPGNYKHEKRF
ncbi:growth arrest-specific protein 8 [Batrachochytrium salamandrivorans]|nr:growth arrest-specific protein 8 [Batrachochytrium salamandrivorans]